MPPELTAQELHRCCDPASLGFETTAEVEALTGALGQDEAMKALAFGVSVASKGYNIFALGGPGSGRRTFIQRALQLRAEKEPTPSSWCYGFNFKDPRHPVALELPAGKGGLLRARLDALLADLKRAIPQALEEKEGPGSVSHLPFRWPESRHDGPSHAAQLPPIAIHLKRHPWQLPRLLFRDIPR